MKAALMAPARALQQRAEAMYRPGDDFAVCTDTTSHPGSVLIAVVVAQACCVIVVPAEEYDALDLARLLGFEVDGPRQTRPEDLVAAKAAAKGKR